MMRRYHQFIWDYGTLRSLGRSRIYAAVMAARWALGLVPF